MRHQLFEEIDGYMKIKRLGADDNSFVWWNQNRKKFPTLAEIARCFLAAPPTSVPSEQLFSGAGLILDKKRLRTSGEATEKLLFLKYNLLFIRAKLC
jgi:hypothetical protein